MTDETWNTGITEIKPNEVRLRGYRIDELMGGTTFGSAAYLALMGELPSPQVGRLIEAILVSSIDHGVTPPSTIAARTSASTGAPLNAAMAAGILSINRFHGAAIEGCMEVLEDVFRRVEGGVLSYESAAQALIAEFRSKKKRIPGFGHRIHSDDPRSKRLLAMADEAGVGGRGIQAIRALSVGLQHIGKSLPINVDGAIAALLTDIGVPRSIANAFFIMARVPGLVAQIQEEQSREKPMRRIDPTMCAYDGPAARALE